MTSTRSGLDWSDDEDDVIVADYFAMLADEVAGRLYVKRAHNRELQAQLGRSAGSIERKHQNISAVLVELGLSWIEGYKPLPNFQTSLVAAIDRYLMSHPEVLVQEPPALPRGLAEARYAFLEPAPLLRAPSFVRPEPLLRLVRKFDPVARDFRNRALGKAGEEFVLEFERERLTNADRSDLARKVRWIADEEGDGAGFDILSFDTRGDERLIEVKTTNGAERTPFYLTRNEKSLAERRGNAFRLYRVYRFAKSPKVFELSPPLEKSVLLAPVTFEASFG